MKNPLLHNATKFNVDRNRKVALNISQPVDSPIQNLCLALLKDAIKGLKGISTNNECLAEDFVKSRSVVWFKGSNDKRRGKFGWVCSILNIEPEFILEELHNRGYLC